MAKKEEKKTDGKDPKEAMSNDTENVKGGGKNAKDASKDSKDAKSKSKAGDDKSKSASQKGQPKEVKIVEEEPPPEDPIIKDLKAQLNTSETELKRIRDVLSIIGSGEGDPREAKIIDLFKKNRYLNLCFEKERNRASKMANQIKFLQEELLTKANETTNAKGCGSKVNDDKKAAEFWKDKHTQIVAKLQIVQARTDMLLGDIAKLQHIIKREVGEHVPVQKVLDEGGTWRGRAEQIALLKDQLEQAHKKIRKLESSSESQSKLALDSDDMTAIGVQHRNTIDKINYERQKELDKLGSSYAALRVHWQEIKAKLDKTVARKNILESDIRNMKAKVGVLVSKSENDDLLINALTLELAAAKQALGPPYSRPGGPLQLEHHYRCNKMAATLTDLKHQCLEQGKEIELQDKIIGNLRASIADPIEGDWCTTELFESTNSEISTLDIPFTEV